MSSGDPARVTLVLTTHDRHEFLEEALESAQQQTYPHIDLVVADDGSTSPRMLELLEQIEGRGVRVLRRAADGVAAARNAAIASTTSAYFMPLDDDDLIEPEYVEQAVRVAQRDSGVGVVYCRADLFGTTHGPWLLPDVEIGPLLVDNQVFATALFRRTDWEAVGGYDEEMREGREDHDFLLKVMGLGRSVHRLEDTFFHYRRHDLPSLNTVAGSSPETQARVHARMFRNNQALYAEQAEVFWLHIFRQLHDARDLRLRYRHLESLRLRFPGAYGLLRRARRSGEALVRRIRTSSGPR